VYSLNQLLELWKPITFSIRTIEEYQKQSYYTQMYTCPTCNLDIFLPQIIGTSSFYGELQSQEEVGYYEETKWEFSESLKDIKNSQSVLEIGCGSGNFLNRIKEIVPDSWGLEYNEDAIKCAKNKGLNITHIDETQKLEKGSFDISVSFHVLEHIAQPCEFVLNMVTWVKKGGKICISVPNQDGPLKYIVPCHMNLPPHHATRWRKKTFEVLADKLNLEIERIAYEPLLLRNHTYYSYYWVNSLIHGTSFFKRIIRFSLSKSLTIFFEILVRCNFTYFNLLKGQSIYVVMSRRDK
jgi:2-polyprenyl-3-methyl-5-hydroxy-6-metoxy-1,4-benzoquinol methylase